MLNYKKLTSEFTQKLAQFDEAKLLLWLAFDKNRDLLCELLDGNTITIQYETQDVKKISDIRENITILNSNAFAMAA